MEHDQNRPDDKIAINALDFDLAPKWVKVLQDMALQSQAHLVESPPMRTLLIDGEVPINPGDYQTMINDLLGLGLSDMLAVLLANLPSEVTELVLYHADSLFSSFKALAVLNTTFQVFVDSVLLNPKTSIVALHFHGFWFTEEQLSSLGSGMAHTSTLQVLGLNACKFEGEGRNYFMSVLQTNKTLKSLRLTKTWISEFAKCFGSNKTLTHLKLDCVFPKGGVSEGATGVLFFAVALTQNSSLLSLEIDDSRLSDEDRLMLISSLAKHPKLECLKLGGILKPTLVTALVDP